jgi:hypothetical protein
MKVLRSIQVRASSAEAAIKHAKALAAYVNAHDASANTQVFIEVFGQGGTLYWLGDVESAGALEQRENQRAADPEWQALGRQGEALFVEGSLRTTLLRPV